MRCVSYLLLLESDKALTLCLPISYLGTTRSKSEISTLVQLLARKAANSLLILFGVRVVYLQADKSGSEA